MSSQTLQIIDSVAREKGIEPDLIYGAMEEAIQKAARSKYGFENDIIAQIDRKTGDISLFRRREVVEIVEDPELAPRQMTVAEAKAYKADAAVGDMILDELPPMDFGRIATQTAKQVVVQKVREAERERQFEEFKDRTGEIINGVVKRVEYGNVTVDIGKAEAILRRDETLPRETIKNGDRIRAVIFDVRREQRGPQIFLSRTHPSFLAKLFMQEVPEIYDGIIEIKAVARDPGSRAKMAVISRDSSIDPVGACVGMRGSRVQAVVNELQGERIDIIPWTEDKAAFIINAIAPAQVTKVVLDEVKQKIEVVVGDDQLSLAIGRRGQNVRLASNLLGWDIDVLTEAQESERRQEEFKTRSELFMAALDVDDVLAHLLVAEGFTNIEEIAATSISELATIEGFDEDVATELQNRARTYLEEKNKEWTAQYKKLGVKEELKEFTFLNPELLVKLGQEGVKTKEDIADLAGDELVEIVGENVLSLDQANELIMSLRASWFDDETEDKKTA